MGISPVLRVSNQLRIGSGLELRDNVEVTDRRPKGKDAGSESDIRKPRGRRRFGALAGSGPLALGC
jgi:hypothetical protein